ncbi:type VI secretion system protein ImpC [Oceanospirillum multiglobuliferum]|uniref:Type VI secretion protein n=1 Tax=Oceanospirillum multiglobuliferum TaxID=64969 RepID=A0A1T4MSI4_9GAMM|nr:type VI secretion system contractile sheath large subunit [Oceanospirillum multiglobuliferum]OPX56905.1 type VI secretion protein [Oceanospirillum multiglobuliferum]SJZ69962.1 type VI secretion system protein ImpC [Oceanospirillum multiglobuliferum]
MSEEIQVQDKQESPLVGEILEFTRLTSEDEGYLLAKQGVEAMLTELLSKDEPAQRVDKSLVDQMIEELDRRLGEQLDEILHNKEFQSLESAWRGMSFLVNRTDFNENIRIELLNVNADELLEDFEDAPELNQSAMFQKVYTEEYGQFGGEPYGVMIGNYELSPAAQDIKLLDYMSGLAAVTHAPFISAASPSFFGLNSYAELPDLKELDSLFDGPQYLKWRGLRDSDDSRNIGLTLPRFMSRMTYGDNKPVRSFNYVEQVTDKEHYLWANASFAYATRLVESFSKYRWCPNIIGPQSGGAVTDLPIHVITSDAASELIGPVEICVSDRKEYELSELGFIPLTQRKNADNATFFSSNSVQKPRQFGAEPEERQAELNYRLGTQLPYLFIVNRLAHYIKVLQRENLGSWKSRSDLESELNRWIRQYVADQESPSPATRSQRPLRKAQILVTEVDGDLGWYQVGLEVTPHFKFMGTNFTLSLTGLLDRV